MATVFDQIKSELKVDAATGVGRCSIRGAARLAGVDQSGLSKRLAGEDFSGSKLAEVLAGEGFQVRTFSVDGIPDSALETRGQSWRR